MPKSKVVDKIKVDLDAEEVYKALGISEVRAKEIIVAIRTEYTNGINKGEPEGGFSKLGNKLIAKGIELGFTIPELIWLAYHIGRTLGSAMAMKGLEDQLSFAKFMTDVLSANGGNKKKNGYETLQSFLSDGEF